MEKLVNMVSAVASQPTGRGFFSQLPLQLFWSKSAWWHNLVQCQRLVSLAAIFFRSLQITLNQKSANDYNSSLISHQTHLTYNHEYNYTSIRCSNSIALWLTQNILAEISARKLQPEQYWNPLTRVFLTGNYFSPIHHFNWLQLTSGCSCH